MLALGATGEARALFDRTRDPPGVASDAPGSVAEALAMAEWARAQNDAPRAQRWFRAASASADRRGAPAELVAVANAYAPALLDAGDDADAAAVVGRVAAWGAHDFDCALLQLRLFHALGQREPWFNALRLAQALAGEREIPPSLLTLSEPASAETLRLTDAH